MRLARPPEDISVGAVVRNAEEDLAIVECFQQGKTHCPIASVCTLQSVLGEALGAFFEVLDRRTLADLLEPHRRLVAIFRHAGRLS